MSAVGPGARQGVLAAGLSRGTNQTGVRLYNERLVLSLIRRHGSLPKADIARHDRPLAADHLDHHQPADRRRPAAQGQRRGAARSASRRCPTRSIPTARSSFGLKIGRRSVDLYLINFVGEVLRLLHQHLPLPHARRHPDLCAERHRRTARGLARASGRAHRRARHRRALRDVDLARGDRRAAEGHRRLAHRRHPRRHRRASAPGRSTSPTTSPPPAPPS